MVKAARADGWTGGLRHGFGPANWKWNLQGEPMKKLPSFPIATAILIVLFTPVTTFSQTYRFSAAVVGGSYANYGFTEVDLAFGPGSYDSNNRDAIFGTLNETLYYNPVADTVCQVGTVSVDPTNFSFAITSRGPHSSYGSADLNLSGDSTLAFDTGTMNLDGGQQAPMSLAIPVTGTVSLVDIAQSGNNYTTNTYNGPISYCFDINIDTTIQSASQQALTVSEYGQAGPEGELVSVGGINLYTGAGGDNTSRYSWSVPTVTAEAVPEPNLLTIFGCGLLTSWRLRRQREN